MRLKLQTVPHIVSAIRAALVIASMLCYQISALGPREQALVGTGVTKSMADVASPHNKDQWRS